MTGQAFQKTASNDNKMMKAVLVSKFGQPNDVITVGEVEVPPRSEKHLQIKVEACSLTPGDYRALLGDKAVVCTPKTWPYIPGGDVCGTIVYVPKKFAKDGGFRVGQKVVATWDIWGIGGFSQYANVLPSLTVPLPEGMSFVEGSALANTASHALKSIQKAKIIKGDRVLVIGASGGIGTLAVQLARLEGASYVGAVTTDEELMKQLGCVNKTVDYRSQNWWEEKDWIETKFDVVLDLAVGQEAYEKAAAGTVIKNASEGGRWVAVVYNVWHIHVESYLGIIGFLLPPIWRQVQNMFRSTTPKYIMYLDAPDKESMKKGLQLVATNQLKLVLDPKSPHPFTTDGVRDAWNHHIARAGHGKIVVKVD